jgi:outer membrane receptor protein involved in Fe transport
VSLAGRNPGDAGMPRWQGLVDARWQSGVWDATWRMRYVGTQTEPCSDGYDGTRLGLSSLGLCSRPGYDAEGRPLLRPDGTPVRPENELDDVLYHDLQLRYEGLGDGVSLSLGVHNLFDAGPPVSTRSFSNSFDPTLYEVPGRFLYVAVGWQL